MPKNYLHSVELKFVWQISGPPATVAHMGNYILGDLHDFGQIGGLPISPKWTNFEILQQFHLQNQNWIWQLMYLGPHIVCCFDKKEVCQSAQNRPISNFFYNSLCKIQIERESVLWKNLPIHGFGAPLCRPFRTNGGVCQSAQNGPPGKRRWLNQLGYKFWL